MKDTNIIRNILHISSTITLDELLYLMRKHWIHIAIVQNEYHQTMGMITLEDVFEAITGNIQDTYDDHIKEIQTESKGSFLILPSTPIERIRNKFKLKLQSYEYGTVGELMEALQKHKSRKGDKVNIETISLEIVSMKKGKISLLRLRTR